MTTLIAIGFLGGLITGISPCILPVLPVIFFSGTQAGRSPAADGSGAVATELGVANELHAEWADSQPDLPGRLERAQSAATAKGWRWAGEMREIAATFAAAGAPPGFHEAAADVYERPR